MNITIAMDVGGTGIKTGVFDSDTRQMIGDMFERPSMSREDKETILNNFADIVSHAISLAPSSQVSDLRMAFPNPFDYDTGTPYIKGNNKYDAIYGVNLPSYLNDALSINPRYGFLNDIKAFAEGEMSIHPEMREARVFDLCLGTGCGSAFSNRGEIEYSPCDGKYRNGEIYDYPYKDGILDQYLSVRGLAKIALDTMGEEYSGKALYDMVSEGNEDAKRVFDLYGEDVYNGVVPVLEDYKADIMVMGGNIGKSYIHFGKRLDKYLKDKGIQLYFTSNTSISAMQGLLTMYGGTTISNSTKVNI